MQKGKLHGKTASQGVESHGNADKSNLIRKQKPHQQLFTTLEVHDRKLSVRKSLIGKYSKPAPPRVMARIKKAQSEARRIRGAPVRIMNSDAMVANVKSHRKQGVTYLLDLREKTCTCGKWFTFRFPCTHSLRVTMRELPAPCCTAHQMANVR